MLFTFAIGLLGSIILVTGAAYPEKKSRHLPWQSPKNWLFAVGGLFMLLYSIMNYVSGGPVLFVYLQVLVNAASVFMMLNISDKIDTPIISGLGIILILLSLSQFEGYSTIFFILGLTGIGLGYAMDSGTFKRNLALTLGSALIALFSYLGASWIFFWLNVFFALFSGYYTWKLMPKR